MTERQETYIITPPQLPRFTVSTDKTVTVQRQAIADAATVLVENPAWREGVIVLASCLGVEVKRCQK